MKEHGLKAKDMVDILNIDKGYVSDILNYKKDFSKDIIRKLAKHFKVSQEAFNWKNSHLRNVSVMNSIK